MLSFNLCLHAMSLNIAKKGQINISHFCKSQNKAKQTRNNMARQTSVLIQRAIKGILIIFLIHGCIPSIFIASKILSNNNSFEQMRLNPLNIVDRISTSSTFTPSTASICGVLGTLLFVGACIWMYIWYTIAFFQGSYFQSSYESQVPPSRRFQTPSDAKLAAIFLSGYTQEVWNHTTLKEVINTRIFQTTSAGSTKYQIANKCDANYFANAINPIVLKDCYTFGQNRIWTYSYATNPSYVGFWLTYHCLNPFACSGSGATITTVKNNLTTLFGNSYVQFKFSTKVLQPDGSSQHQVYTISSGQFNSPYTLSTSLEPEVILSNIHMDYSIWPWKSTVKRTNIAYYGLVKGTVRAATSVTSLPKFQLVSAPYQHYVYRHYVKGDRWIGVVCGGCFLVHLYFFTLCFYVNLLKSRMAATEQLVLQIDSEQYGDGLTKKVVVRSPAIPFYYYLPFCSHKAIQRMKQLLDISNIVKELKRGERNIMINIKSLENMPVILEIQPLLQKERKGVKNQHGLQPQKQKNNNGSQQDKDKDKSSILMQQETVAIANQSNNQTNNFGHLPNQSSIQELPALQQSNNILDDSLRAPIHLSHQPQQDIPKYPQNQLCDLMNIEPQVMAALRNSNNTKDIFSRSPALMHATGNQQQFEKQKEHQSNNDEPFEEPKGRQVCTKIADFLSFLDMYKVKIAFSAGTARSSCVGFLFVLALIGCSILFLFNQFQNLGTFQTSVTKQFQQPSQIKYSVSTGRNFRPAVCFSYSAQALLSSNNVTLKLYTYSGSKMTYYTPVDLQYGQADILGITADSPYANLDTSNCHIFPDNVKIDMGGYNTAHEAYFGFRIEGYCTGTSQYCQSNINTINANLYSFLSTSSNTFTFYTPVNQYLPDVNTIFTGQVFPRPLRQGTSKFNATSSVEETAYLDRIQLLDNYNKRANSSAPQVIQEAICSSRYQLATNIKYVNSATAYYQFRARPSGNLTKVTLEGSTLFSLLGTIGGVLVFMFCIFGWLGYGYNTYNVRTKLAEVLFGQTIYYYNAFTKILFLLGGRLVCCGSLGMTMKRMYLIDEKIKYILNTIETVKELISCRKLSENLFQPEVRKLVQIYFKETINEASSAQKTKKEQSLREQSQKSQQFQQFVQEEGDSEGSSHKNQIVNMSYVGPSQQNLLEESLPQAHPNEQQYSSASQTNQRGVNRKKVEYFQKYKGQQYYNKISKEFWVKFFDLFRSDPQFTLKGKWRVGSVFGFILTVITATILILVFWFYIFVGDNSSRTSYNRGMLVDPENTPPLQLISGLNFCIAFGFYIKPGMSFVNVSNLINGTISSSISISLYQVSQVWNNNQLTIKQTKYDLIPCQANYFDGFMSPNDDPSYFSSITNGFCLPKNIKLNLTSNTINNTQYFKFSIYNNTVAGSALLTTLTTSYPLGVYMTIPVINLANKEFGYKVQQIRPNTQTLTKALEVNITLTKQQFIYNSPNYTINQNSTTVESYNYIEDRAYERTMNLAPTTVARVYNITFSHSGFVETYNITYPNIMELIGYFGGITFLVFLILGCMASSFNTYYRDYLIGQELYLYVPLARVWKGKQGKQSKGYSEKDIILLNKKTEFDVFKAWLLSFLAVCSQIQNQNYLVVNTIQQKVQQDIDICNFYKKFFAIKYTLNSLYQLQSNKDIPITNIYSKQIAFQTQPNDSKERNKATEMTKLHNLSYRSQQILSQYELSDIFDKDYLKKCMLTKYCKQKPIEHNYKLEPQIQRYKQQNFDQMPEPIHSQKQNRLGDLSQHLHKEDSINDKLLRVQSQKQEEADKVEMVEIADFEIENANVVEQRERESEQMANSQIMARQNMNVESEIAQSSQYD